MKLTDEDGLLWYRVSGGCEGDPKREKKISHQRIRRAAATAKIFKQWHTTDFILNNVTLTSLCKNCFMKFSQ